MHWLRGSFLAATAAFGVAISPLAAGAQTFTTYDNACDASGAIALGQDMFLLADNNSNVLRTYKIGTAKPVAELPISKFLGVGKKQEADIEAAARVTDKAKNLDRVYFITSHGLNTSVVLKEQRLRLFAYDVSATGDALTEYGNPYILLRQTMLADTRYQEYLSDAEGRGPEVGGINIEGLAEGPNGSLYAGFRSPAAAKIAIVMPILNPGVILEAAPKLTKDEDMVERMKRATEAAQVDLGPPIVFKTLEGRGIRSIEKVGDKYLIIAGPPSNEDLTFELFSWSGKVGDDPVLISGHKLTFADKPMLKPEVVFARPDGGLYIISDDGDLIAAEYKKAHPGVSDDEAKCENLGDDEKHFRGFDLPAVH